MSVIDRVLIASAPAKPAKPAEHPQHRAGLDRRLETSMSEPTTFTDVLARWEAERPDGPAISFGAMTLSWSELADRVRRNAAA
jgi:hypothetical protein